MSVKQMSNGIAVVDKNSVVLLIFSNRRKIITINQNVLPYHTSMGDNAENSSNSKRSGETLYHDFKNRKTKCGGNCWKLRSFSSSQLATNNERLLRCNGWSTIRKHFADISICGEIGPHQLCSQTTVVGGYFIDRVN